MRFSRLASDRLGEVEFAKLNAVVCFATLPREEVGLIIAHIEVGAEASDRRFVVTNLKARTASLLYRDVYCRRGQAENPYHVLEGASGGRPNRVFLHAGSYWIT